MAKTAEVPLAIPLEDLRRSLAEAEEWAEGGYSVESRAYWTGMRDTLRVLLGITTKPPTCSVDDPAALTLLRRST
jgi:hypothetical protein